MDDKELFNVQDRQSGQNAFDDLDAFVRKSPQVSTPDLGTPAVPQQPATPSEQYTIGGQLWGGLRAGFSQVGTDLRAAAAVGSALLGEQEDALKLMDIVVKRSAEDEKAFPRAIQRVEDIEDISDFTKWAARSLGEQVPVMASMLLGGLGGRVLGTLVGRGVTSLGASHQLVARFPGIFTGFGVYSTAAGIETGATATELFAETGKLEPEVSFAAGIVKGALESATPWAIGRTLNLSPGVAQGLTSRVMREFERVLPQRMAQAAGVGAMEGVTETLQEVVDLVARAYVDEHYDILGPEARSRILNAAVTGAFVGGVFGLAHRGNRQQTRLEEGTPVMPTPLGLGSPDIEIGPGVQGIPFGPNIVINEDPATLPPLNPPSGVSLERSENPQAPMQQAGLDNTGVVNAAYDPTQPPGPNNTALFGGPLNSKVPPAQQTMAIRTEYPGAISLIADEMRAAGTIDTATGKPYDPGKHAPGTVVNLETPGNQASTAKTPFQRQAMQAITKFLNQEMKRIGLDARLVVFGDSLRPQNSQSTGATFHISPHNAGHYVGFEYHPHDTKEARSPFAVIALQLSKVQTTQDLGKLFSTAAHEFGHFIAHQMWAKAPIEVSQRIQQEYQDAATKAAYGDLRYAGPLFGPDRARQFDKLVDIETTNIGTFGPQESYFLKFDEYAAEQISKYYMQLEAGKKRWLNLTATQKLWKSIAEALLNLFRAVKHYPGARDVDVGIRQWMDSLTQRKTTPLSQLVMDTVVQQGQAVNAPILAPVSGGAYVPPPQPATGGLGRLLDRLGIPKLKSREIRAFADKFSWFMDLFMNIQQIGQHNPHIKPVQRYLELVDQWYNFQMNWMGRADERLREWRALGPDQARRLAQMLFAVDSMEYRTPAEIAAGTLRQPTNAELAGLKTKYGLNTAAFQQFIKVREDFNAVLDQIERTSLNDIQRTLSPGPAQQQAIAELTREMAALRSRPYFPHARFGDWSVVIKDKKGGKTIFMQQFRTQREAANALPDLLATAKRTHPNAIARPDYIPKEVHGFRGLPPNLIAKIKQNLNLSATQNEWLDNLIVEMAPSASFRHHLQKRMNTPGFSLDAQRAYANYFFHGARHLARIEYGPALHDEVSTGMNQAITDLEGTPEVSNAPTRRRIQEYMANHLEHILNPQPDWAHLRSAAFLWYLGFNVSSAALNLTQPMMVGMPYLAARFGDRKAIGAMMKAVRDIQNVYKYKQPGRVSAELLKALDRAMHEGVVEESQAAELAASAQGGYLAKLTPGNKLQRFVQQMNQMGGWMFTQTERINRRVMFRAAWELAQKNPNTEYLNHLAATNSIAMQDMLANGFTVTEAKAYLAAKDAVHQTQFRYGQHARPKFMRGKLSVVFTFFMFTQNMLHFVRYSPGSTRYLIMMLFMAGLMGLPGAEDLEAMAKMLARNLLGKEFDLSKEVRELVTGMLGDEVPPDLFLHGMGRVGFGLPAMMDLIGIPKAQFDFSRRIGLGRIIPGLAELGSPGTDFDEAMSRAGQQAAGATFGIGFNIIRALADDQLPMSDFKRWERLMPTALSNMSKVLRYASEGRERSRNDATIVDYNLTDPDHIVELALRGIGFQPTRVAREWDRIKMQREAEAFWVGRRAVILKLWSHSFGMNDPDMRDQALQDVRQYNAEVPFGTMKITGDQLAKSRKEHLRQIRLREAGLTNSKAMRPLVRAIESLHPETRTSEIVDVSVVR